jgi:hypothetical protein
MTDKTWSSEEDTVEKADRNSYPADDGDSAGGISNRPLDEEIENQETLPERGTTQEDEQDRSNVDEER